MLWYFPNIYNNIFDVDITNQVGIYWNPVVYKDKTIYLSYLIPDSIVKTQGATVY